MVDIGSLMSLGTGESWGARREGSLGSVGSLESEGSKKNLGSEGSKESGKWSVRKMASLSGLGSALARLTPLDPF